MVQVFQVDSGGSLRESDLSKVLQSPLEKPFWIDLLEPADQAIQEIEEYFQIDIPTRQERIKRGHENRIYREKDAWIFIVTVIAKSDQPSSERTQIAFIVTPAGLITLRNFELTAFRSFVSHPLLPAQGRVSSMGLFLRLVEELVDRLGDVLGQSTAHLDRCSTTLFQNEGELSSLLKEIGRIGDHASKMRESLLSINRTLVFISTDPSFSEEERLKAGRLLQDCRALSDDAAYFLSQLNFVQEATLGLISIEQNNTIKILSVVAVVFLPPTLIASIYGMNFAHMPELQWPWGYPLALFLIVLSAILPVWYFRKRGWL